MATKYNLGLTNFSSTPLVSGMSYTTSGYSSWVESIRFGFEIRFKTTKTKLKPGWSVEDTSVVYDKLKKIL